jgi:excinuclease ABC subunit C
MPRATVTAPRGPAGQDVTPKVADILAHLPDAPGVYLMKDADGGVLYVGKAKSLRARVRSYFQKGAAHTPKTRIMVRKVRDIETVVTASEVEALVLENNLIKRHRPPYNVMLRDDKNYPYIRLSVNEPFPRLTVVRKVKDDGAKYYGPYVGAGAMRQTLRLIHAHFPLADCDIVIDGQADRPCLQYQIGRCKAPCTGYQTRADYAETVREVRLFLEGRDRELVAELAARMQAAAEAEAFERAAALRDRIRQIDQTLARQRITTPGGGEVDVYGLARAGGWASLQVLFVRDGSLVGTKAFVWEDLSGVPDGDIYGAFIQQFYEGGVPIPARLLLPSPVPDTDAVADWLGTLRGKACRLESPSRGRGMALLTLAASNAERSLEARLEAERAGERGLMALQKALRLKHLPHRVEGFDISHIQGDLTVASMVVWEGSGPKKSDYRHFRIRSTTGPDDFLAMGEAVSRRYRKVLDAGEAMPDLILIDGGRGQVGAALRALADLKVPAGAMPEVVGLAKERGDRFERVFRPGWKEAVPLKPGAPATRILQQIRDEAHRFAITYHRKLRSLRIQDSVLDGVPGIGPARKRRLLSAFGSVEGLKGASVDAIAALPGMTRPLAEAVHKAVRP